MDFTVSDEGQISDQTSFVHFPQVREEVDFDIRCLVLDILRTAPCYTPDSILRRIQYLYQHALSLVVSSSINFFAFEADQLTPLTGLDPGVLLEKRPYSVNLAADAFPCHLQGPEPSPVFLTI